MLPIFDVRCVHRPNPIKMSFVVLQMNGSVGDAASANNTGESSVNATKPWEHAWTVEEMRNTASNWHLANDVGVSCLVSMFIVE